MKETFNPAVRLSVLTDKQVRQVHDAALQVLEETGVLIPTEEGRKILGQAGCQVGGDHVVSIPSKRVEEALKSTPQSITLYGRTGDKYCELEGWKTSFGTGSDCPFIYDRRTEERRRCTQEDILNGARVLDALENINFIMPMGIISDRPTHSADIHAASAVMEGSVKPVVFTAENAYNLNSCIDLAAAVSGDHKQLQEKPTICLYNEPISPLKYSPEVVDKLILAARQRIPVVFTPCPLGGATAPATAAGLITQATAECLSGVVLHQLVNPGAPIIFGGVMYMLDMVTAVSPYGSPELHQMCAALTCMAHHYQLPMFGTCGCSDSKVVDAQAGLEMGFSVLTSTLSGQNLVHDIGYLESGLITSYEMYILADEAIGMAKHIARGIRVTQETLATEVIHEVGHTGEFLMHDHTLNNFRQEFYFPKYLDRKRYAAWEEAGRRTLYDQLKEKADELIDTHKPAAIDTGARGRMMQILEEADRRSAGTADRQGVAGNV
jgi:trimethylamine--corrinoid protein Co-methyltransferase